MLTTYAKNIILNGLFRGDGIDASVPANWYLGFSTTTIDTSGSDSMTEPSGGGYARVAFPADTDTWDEATAGTTYNKVAKTFTESSASWGTLLSAFLADGNGATDDIWFYYDLDPTLPVSESTEITIGIGKITSEISDD